MCTEIETKTKLNERFFAERMKERKHKRELNENEWKKLRVRLHMGAFGLNLSFES